MVLRPITNTHENMANIMSTGCGSALRRIWGLMEESSTNGASGVLIDGGKWYLWCVRCDMGSFVEVS